MLMTCKNKDGKDVQYTFELMRDMAAVHNISIAELFANLHGTEFSIEKRVESSRLKFCLKTNDDRDSEITWNMVG